MLSVRKKGYRVIMRAFPMVASRLSGMYTFKLGLKVCMWFTIWIHLLLFFGAEIFSQHPFCVLIITAVTDPLVPLHI